MDASNGPGMDQGATAATLTLFTTGFESQQKHIHYVTLRLVFTADVSQVAAALQCVQQVAVVEFSCGVGFVPARNLSDLNMTCKTIRLPL